MKAKYSPDFAEAYRALSPELQRRFQEVDRRVQADDLSDLDRQGWAYFIDLDAVRGSLNPALGRRYRQDAKTTFRKEKLDWPQIETYKAASKRVQTASK